MPLSNRKWRTRRELDELPYRLAEAAVAFRRMNDFALKEVGLNTQPLGAGTVFRVLFELKRCTVKSLVEQTKIPNGTLTGVLDGLEKGGFIRREENAEDGRSWLIELTPKGRRSRGKLMRRHQIIVEKIESVLSQKEAALLENALRRLADAMNGCAGVPSHGGSHAQSAVRRRRPEADVTEG